MTDRLTRFLLALGVVASSLRGGPCPAQELSPRWDELTSADFRKAIDKAQGTCVLPLGSVEKFGAAGPVGTSLYVTRQVALDAARQEYAVVFPEYFVSQTNAAAIHPGTIAYSGRLQREMLDETTAEMGRNGCRKILILHAASANDGILRDFLTSSMSKQKDYVLYVMHAGPPRMWPLTEETAALPAAMRASKPNADGHGGEDRISALMAFRPDLVRLEHAQDDRAEPAAPAPKLPRGVEVRVSGTTTHGDASGATVARGKALMEYAARRAVEAIRAVKADADSPRLQKEFFEKRSHPTE
jgi:creatinine amidohydrolase